MRVESVTTTRTCNLYNQLLFAGGYVLNLPQCQHSVNNLTKDNVLSIQKITFGSCYEKLEEKGFNF